MSFRGLDFSPGFNAYAEILRAAYQDRQKQEQLQMQSAIAQQQANALYGFEGPAVVPVDNPFFDPAMAQEFVSPETASPEQGSPFMGDRAPQGMESRGPAVEPKDIRDRRERLRRKALDLGTAKLEQLTEKASSPAPQSIADRLIQRYAGQEKISPYALRQILEFKQAERSGGSDAMTGLLAAMLSNTKEPYQPPPPRAPQPRTPPKSSVQTALEAEYKALGTIQGQVAMRMNAQQAKARQAEILRQLGELDAQRSAPSNGVLIPQGGSKAAPRKQISEADIPALTKKIMEAAKAKGKTISQAEAEKRARALMSGK